MGGIVSAVPFDNTLPGMGTKVTMKTRKVLINDKHVEYEAGVVIEKATVDAGSTPTTLLRPGMVLVRVESGANKGKYVQYGHADAPSSAGAVKKSVVLGNYVSTKDQSGTTKDQSAIGNIHGRVDEAQVIYVSSDSSVKAALRAGCPLVEFVPALA
jgi:hypothetical protein